MMARASLARSRAVVTCAGAGRPFGLTNTVLLIPSRLRRRVHIGDERRLAAGDGFGEHHGDVVGGLDDQRLQALVDRHLAADRQADLAGRLLIGGRRARDLRFEVELAGLERLEHEVGRHDLGQRGRMPEIIGVLGVENLAVRDFDDECGTGHGRARGEALRASVGRRMRCRSACNSLVSLRPRRITHSSALLQRSAGAFPCQCDHRRTVADGHNSAVRHIEPSLRAFVRSPACDRRARRR